jgi:hypothetical protein
VAGAGVSDHLHEHVVPRWQGDANFMPILASTVVMPELIPATYAKLRAEMYRTQHPKEAATSVVLFHDGQRVLVDESGNLPRFHPGDSESVWHAALRDAQEHGATNLQLLGWAGASRAGEGPLALMHRATFPEHDSATSVPFADLDESDRTVVRAALSRIDDSA